ncbi:uncharacterized protein BT62DRAFT_1036690 [Guyanagaster necrorhizus]|uniref:Uncharacterized protein n=1 Tax=Guyanagaster necrorhizus TaxID=856835 RepID=A0A9P7VFS8_9AGAR|nr:uncharacterized protein BT62DRAFT_1055075 [Guyanagaster necrorhizus MCA 3950]XP_043036032.1 uncharacterized protein BT62DRAFT_1036690 [Guyanagaster necrorhizus MCA 3950]KAG7439750.1 hypothetical protein BT62DRAFT_1055075 [Guyanagaster necrorhizus MCA 3950]KAG7442532.1 hypothetical protein BT62DRAFT_1036690 [Guyanagaster necrorhizus MCA 3950]
MSSNVFSVNETARTFTRNNDNVVSALEQIPVNVTIALITAMSDATVANASVVQDQLIWVYHSQRLWIIYGTSLALTAACCAIRSPSILQDRQDSDLAFWDIVRETRNLDAVVEEEKSGKTRGDTLLQYAVQGKNPDTDTSGVFVLTRPHHKGSS